MTLDAVLAIATISAIRGAILSDMRLGTSGGVMTRYLISKYEEFFQRRGLWRHPWPIFN